ncbi:lipase chaperone [Blastococcus saxobsidens]|uniref:Uncharacterized protein n=1 Tax=Blastococcus saxobsidens (strain DD2) TaxID=1146883 RepID=H6RTT0_BLASD|nr:lipase chaperone [Blastococcus saxobsidens]CCG03140.1 conserved exported protein of unknown function [Blastococcus saxobsidens DD2]
MIMGAALLVLLGLGLFVAGLLTGVTAWYWACVAVCAAAAVLIVLARRSMSRAPVRTAAGAAGASGPVAAAPAETVTAATPAGTTESGASAAGAPVPAVRHDEPDDPPVEEVEVTDLLLIVDLTDEVLVVDEHPRYHVADCRWLQGRSTIPLPLDEARTDGFTPCGVCRPDRTLAARARARRSGS